MHGNRVTALRWAKRLRELGWRVVIGVEWAGEPCDLLVALHARKSHASVVRHAQQHPDVARVIAGGESSTAALRGSTEEEQFH